MAGEGIGGVEGEGDIGVDVVVDSKRCCCCMR